MANKPINKQKGFVGLIDLYAVIAAVIVFMSIAAGYLSDRQIEQDADRLKQHIEGLIEAINTYQSDMYTAGVSFRSTDIFPNTLNDLMPNYLPSCTAQENRNRQCKLPTQTPWGQNIGYSTKLVAVPINGGTVDVPGYELTIPVGLEPTAEYRHTYAAALMRLPFSKWDESTGLLTVSFGRLGSEVEHEALVNRDGSSTLLDHWDVGGDAAILNTRDITVRNANNTQRSLGRGVVHAFSAKSGESFHEHSCPKGSTADVMVTPKGLIPDDPAHSFSETGAFSATHTFSGSAPNRTYTVKLEYWAKESSGSQNWQKRTEGYVNVFLTCK